MGLGKTIQSISILALVDSFMSESDRLNRRSHHIIIVPKVTLGKWNKEIQQWAPSLRLFQFYGTGEEREVQK
jgi:SNF2 family DNA or RNA helicase